MSRALRAVLGGIALLLAPGPVLARPVVILLSLDGVRHDYLDRGGLPAFERMAKEGARAEALVPVFPSSTFPNHAALATGARTDRHGIVANRFFDPELGEFDFSADASFLEAEPIWAAAERQGVRSAAFFWVGSETDWRGVGATYRRTPFDDAVPESEKVEQILAWLGLPAAERPRLVVSWWRGADRPGHRFGPDSERTTSQLWEQDRELGRLLAALDARQAWSETTLLVVSDHGMVAVNEGIDLRVPLEEAAIPGTVLAGGAVALVYLEDPERSEEARAALAAVPGVRVFRSDTTPEPLRYRHPTRTGDLVALVDPPRMLTRGSASLERWRRLSRFLGNRVGTHGYDPEAVPEMGAIFLALGRGVAAGTRLGRPRSIDVAPTVSRLLGIEPPAHAEGRPIPGIGGAAPSP